MESLFLDSIPLVSVYSQAITNCFNYCRFVACILFILFDFFFFKCWEGLASLPLHRGLPQANSCLRAGEQRHFLNRKDFSSSQSEMDQLASYRLGLGVVAQKGFFFELNYLSLVKSTVINTFNISAFVLLIIQWCFQTKVCKDALLSLKFDILLIFRHLKMYFSNHRQ